MSKQMQQASGVMIALVLTTTWLHGCGGNVTADDRRLAADDSVDFDRPSEARERESSKPSLLDRLLGDRTR
jgi:hypothetical protein